MQFRKPVWLAALFLLSAILTACNMGATPAPTQDVGAIQTQAMGLVSTQMAMQQTQTAMAVPPTSLPSFTPAASVTPGTFPTVRATTGTPFIANTPAAGITPLTSPVPTQVGDTCHRSAFIEDVTVPDGTEFKPGADFEKAWSIQNTGSCIWDDGYKLKYLGGMLDGYDVPIDQTREFVKPGEIREFKVDLTAPLAEGYYEDCWKMVDDGGYFFGTPLCVKIVVD